MKSALITFILALCFSFLSVWFTFNWVVEISSFAVSIAKGALGVFLFWVFDRFALKEIETIEELKKGNIAYAIFVLGICIIIAAAVMYS